MICARRVRNRRQNKILAAAILCPCRSSPQRLMTNRSEGAGYEPIFADVIFSRVRTYRRLWPEVAQNIENGRRLAERWCTQCHATDPGAAALKGVRSFAS